MKHLMHGVAFATLLSTLSTAVMAGEDNTLFNPTPDDELRAMTTERPSKTDSPYSLDAGHFQIETNVFATIRNDDGNTDTHQDFFGGANNIRIGLTDTIDFQIISDLYRTVEVKDKLTGIKTKREGFGDTQLRLKVNLIGNDPSSKFALGVIPYVKLPTAQDDLGNDEYEGGIGLPFNANFEGGWSFGGMTQLNLITQPDGSGYDPAYVNSVIVGKSLTDKLSAYGEFYTYRADQSGAHWLNTVDLGTVYAITDNFKVDANIALGVTDAADDSNFFVGFAYRF